MKKLVTSVEAKEGKYGMYKTLFFEDGSKMTITHNNRSYDTFTGPGEYDITTKDYNGKEVISSAKKLSKGDLTSAKEIVSKKPMTAAQTMEERIRFERETQKDIMVECYMGIAKDIALANQKTGGKLVIEAKDVESIAFDLIAAHFRVKNGKNIPAIVGDIQAAFPGSEVVAPQQGQFSDVPKMSEDEIPE